MLGALMLARVLGNLQKLYLPS